MQRNVNEREQHFPSSDFVLFSVCEAGSLDLEKVRKFIWYNELIWIKHRQARTNKSDADRRDDFYRTLSNSTRVISPTLNSWYKLKQVGTLKQAQLENGFWVNFILTLQYNC